MNRRVLPALVAAALVTLCTSAASAQTVGELLGSATWLQFESEDGEPLVISKYDTDADDGTYVPLCTTPCSFQLPAGSYDLMAGDHKTFTVQASGGIQEWLVEDKSIGGIAAGAALTALGPGLPLATFLVRVLVAFFTVFTWSCTEGNDDDNCTFMNDATRISLIVTGSVGGAMLVTGVSLLATSFGTAELISSTSGTVGLGSDLRLVPGLFAYENPSGGHNLGLGLQLRF